VEVIREPRFENRWATMICSLAHRNPDPLLGSV